MATRVYVGNLAYGTTDGELLNLFAPHGTVRSARVARDRETKRSRGFGFVEMDSGEEARAAIRALNGREIDGRALTVNEARPREDHGGGTVGGGRS